MRTEKSFDVLVIESPEEYRIDLAKSNSLKNIGDLCRKQNIPIRIPWGNTPCVFRSAPKGESKDYLIRKYFNGCDYQPTFRVEELADLGTNEHVKILLSGGFLDYATGSKLIAILEDEPKLNKDEIVNLDKTDNNRQIVIPVGCVSARAQIIHQDISRTRQNAEIYIDGLSTVGYYDHINHPYSVFKITKVSRHHNGIGSYLIIRRILRSNIIPE